MLEIGHKDKGASSAWGKAFALVVCAMLLLTVAVGSTVAYLWDKSDTYVNTFVADSAPCPEPLENPNFNIDGSKSLIGRDWQEGDEFTFLLQQCKGIDPATGKPVWDILDEQTIAYTPGSENWDEETFNEFGFDEAIGGLEFPRVGAYLFRVVEAEGDIPGVSYAKVPVEFTVHVGKKSDENGLEITCVTTPCGVVAKSEETGLFEVPAIFENSYSATGEAQVVIQINKTVKDTTVSEGDETALSFEGFAFQLFKADEEFKVAEGALPVEGGFVETNILGEALLPLKFAAEDADRTHRYVLKEIVPSLDESDEDGVPVPGMTYDEAERWIEVKVVDNGDGTLSAVVADCTERKNEEKGEPAEPGDTLLIEFINVYDPADAEISLDGTKILTGRDLVAGEFSFLLYESVASFPELGEEAEPIDAATNAADGSFVFDVLRFGQVGAYYYVVTEDASAALEGVTYDETIYGVLVKVTDPGAGRLSAEATVVDTESSTIAPILFENAFEEKDDPGKPDDPDVPPVDPGDPDVPPVDSDQPVDSEQPNTPDKPNEPGKPGVGQTGDQRGSALLMMAAITCLASLIVLVFAYRMRRLER